MNRLFLRGFFVLLFFGIFLVNTAVTSAADSGAGIEGVIAMGPTHGGPIRVGMPRSKPLPNVTFTVQKAGEEKSVASFTTDEQGRFHVELPPGKYSVIRAGGKQGIGRFGPFDVEVTAGKMTTVEWHCDSGMR